MSTIRRYLSYAILTGVCLLVHTEYSLAQTEAAAPSNSRPVTRSLMVEYAVVGLLIAGAVYSVCRSSRRM